ncbi:MAG TPA: hypothetical protein PKL84_07950, partial [Candidatus Hydrogenedentes bacterium]|nr:hypothetical protein [Candidatus Hydrogenedentota bacterium]
TARISRRLRNRRAGGGPDMSGFRLTRHARFCVETLLVGFFANGLARLFLWRARVGRPVFDPIEYPNSYSRAMDLWTYGFLGFVVIATGFLVWRAAQLRRRGRLSTARP